MISNEEKIPIEKVIDDMYNPNGGMVSEMARDYYYMNYASPEEQKWMDHEDRVHTIVAIAFMIILVLALIVAIVLCLS